MLSRSPLWVLLLVLQLFLAGCYLGRLGLDGSQGDDDSATDDDDSATDDDDATIGNDDDATDDDDDATDDDDDATDDDDLTTDDDDFSGVAELDSVDSLSPATGSAEGGETVDILYTGDLTPLNEGDVLVTFDGQEATVVAITADEIVVSTPPACSPGSVSVSVSVSGLASGTGSFSYETWADDQDVAVIGAVASDWPALGTGFTGQATAEFFTPTNSPPMSSVPPMGTCIQNVNIGSPTRDHYSVGNSVTLGATTGSPFTLPWGADSLYTSGSLSTTHLPGNNHYSLSGGLDADGCAVDLPGVMSSTQAMWVTDPPNNAPACGTGAYCFFKTPDAAHPGLDGVTPVWTAGAGDGVLLQFEWVDYCGVNPSTPPDSLLCNVPDIGSFNVPDTYLIGLTPGLYNIAVTRYKTITTVHPRSGGTVYGTFMDQQGVHIWIYQTASECQTYPCWC